MTINLYKIRRGSYKLVVFSEKFGLETFQIKGKNEMRKKEKQSKNSMEALKRHRVERFDSQPYKHNQDIIWPRDEELEQFGELPEPTTIANLLK